MTGRVCSNPDCARPVTARGMCRMHYLQKWREGAHTDAPTREKRAHRCPDDHPHDLETCWATHGCRCQRCSHLRKMERQRRRNRMMAYGRWEGRATIPVEPVRRHVLELRAAGGFGLERIARAAGVGTGVVFDVVYGPRGSQKDRRAERITRASAEKILALTPERIDPAFAEGRGTSRRLQALVAIGYTESYLAERLGVLVGNLSPLVMNRRPRVMATTHTAVAALFEELWSTRPEGPRAERARRLAAAHGWLPPLAWDDIDTDPTPEGDVVKQGRASADEVLDDVEFLLEAGESPEQVAATVGRKIGTLAKLAERNGRRDLASVFWAIDKKVAA